MAGNNYKNEWKKQNTKIFKADLPKEECLEYEDFLKQEVINKAEFIRLGVDLIRKERGIKMNLPLLEMRQRYSGVYNTSMIDVVVETLNRFTSIMEWKNSEITEYNKLVSEGEIEFHQEYFDALSKIKNIPDVLEFYRTYIY